MVERVLKKEGSVFGGVLLIAGSCIGAGMLGLPILTGMAGFFPSLVMFALACLFMTTTALLLIEVDGWFKKRVNFLTMIDEMLGPWGKRACWILYLFLFYALLVAYIAGSGNHVSAFLGRHFGLSFPVWYGSLFFVCLFGYAVYLGTKPVDMLNRLLMFAKIVVYCALVGIGVKYVEPQALEYTEVKYAFFALPVLVISFGFHNMIPTLSHYLGGDVKRIRKSIIGGALFALSIYLFWQVIALGSLPLHGDVSIFSSYKRGIDAAEALALFSSSSWIGSLATALAFFAILTSFLAQSLSLVHFLADGMQVERKEREPIAICILALLPPLIFASLYPSIFYQALNFAGGICAVVLFGIFPVMMVWKGRAQRGDKSGRFLLSLIALVALFILFYQTTETVGFHIFPRP